MNNMKKIRNFYNETQEEVGKVIGVNKATISRYESGNLTNLKVEQIKKLVNHWNVSPAIIMNIEKWEENKYVKNINNDYDLKNFAEYVSDNHSLTCLGYATAGLLEEQFEQDLGKIEVPEKFSDPNKYMCVKVSGDSMDKKLPDGAYAVFNKTTESYNNKIVLINVNNQTTIKYFKDYGSVIVLSPSSFNPTHQDIAVNKEDIEDFKIYGTLAWYCYFEE